jgi:DNA-binding NtrC family response regulator
MGPDSVEAAGPLGAPLFDVEPKELLAFGEEDEDEDGLSRVLGITAAETPAEIDLNEASLKDRVSDFERQLIEKALADANGNISEASRLLSVKRTTLIEKMTRLNITKS